MKKLNLGLQLGHRGAGPPADVGGAVMEAERLGHDSVTAEAYGSDALTPLAWWGSRTTRNCRHSLSAPPPPPAPPLPPPWLH